jgi:hypothetical protein
LICSSGRAKAGAAHSRASGNSENPNINRPNI